MPTGGVTVIRIVSGKNPFQTFLMGLFAVSGVALLGSAPEPDSVNAIMDPWAVKAWGASLLSGAVIALAGAYWRGLPETASMIEILGCCVYAVASTVYPTAIVVRILTADPDLPLRLRNSWLVLGILFALSWAAIARIVQIRRGLREVAAMRAAMSRPAGEESR